MSSNSTIPVVLRQTKRYSSDRSILILASHISTLFCLQIIALAPLLSPYTWLSAFIALFVKLGHQANNRSSKETLYWFGWQDIFVVSFAAAVLGSVQWLFQKLFISTSKQCISYSSRTQKIVCARNAYYMTFYILMGSASYYSLTEASGRPAQAVLFDFVATFQVSPATELQKWLCMFNIGFWLCGLVTVLLSNPTSDAVRMHSSRAAGFSLILYLQLPNLCLVIFVFIAMSDCLLHLAKIFAALRDRSQALIAFCFYTFTYILTRHFVFSILTLALIIQTITTDWASLFRRVIAVIAEVNLMLVIHGSFLYRTIRLIQLFATSQRSKRKYAKR